MKIINPHMPDEYKYEEDYRNIPREHLNPRIPSGRGIVKWNAFKTLPQQYEMINQYMEDQNKIEMPLLSQEQLEEINDKVNYKIENKILAEINYWKNGYIHSIQSFIYKIDELKGEMILLNENKSKKLSISLTSIVSVE